MSNQEQVLSEALQRAVQVVETVEDRYREAAFPIILQAFLGLPTTSAKANGADQKELSSQAPEPSLPSALSVNEFFRRANPDTHPARFVAAAYYLLHTGKAEQFSQADLVEIYHKLRQPQPKNYTDVMNQCIKKVFVIDASTKEKQKYWTITPDGERYVEGLLNDDNGSSAVTG